MGSLRITPFLRMTHSLPWCLTAVLLYLLTNFTFFSRIIYSEQVSGTRVEQWQVRELNLFADLTDGVRRVFVRAGVQTVQINGSTVPFIPNVLCSHTDQTRGWLNSERGSQLRP